MHNYNSGVLTIFLLIATLTGGCSSVRDIYAGVYDVFRYRQQQETLPGERTSVQAPMSYPQYEAERDRVLRRNPGR